MIVRLGWFALCGAFALIALGLQLDRTARHNPAVAGLVPAPFRGFAQEQRAAIALHREGDDAAALTEAQALVRKRPVPAENLALLSLAASRAGDEELAGRAMILSAERGWRQPLAQYVVVRGAIEAEEWSTAGDRLYALWATGNPDQIVTDATIEALAQAQGRQAFARRLAQNPHWRNRYLGWGSRHLEPAVHADTVRRALLGGTLFDCARLAEQSRTALRRGQPGLAADLWGGHCAVTGADDGRSLAFPAVRPVGSGGPFDWTFPTRGGLSVNLRGDGDSSRLDYRNTDPFRAVIARRHLRLDPGRYAVELKRDGPPSAPGVSLTMSCIDAQGRRARALELSLPENPSATMEVPAAGCAVQIAEISAPRGTGEGLHIALSGAGPT